MSNQNQPISKAQKYILIAAGTLLVAIGAIGIVLPILPTTPFLLLAAVCYMHSSARFYNWLLGNRVPGVYIRAYHSGEGLPPRAKAFTIALLWVTIGTSAIFFVDLLWVRVLLLVIAIMVTMHIVSIGRPKR